MRRAVSPSGALIKHTRTVDADAAIGSPVSEQERYIWARPRCIPDAGRTEGIGPVKKSIHPLDGVSRLAEGHGNLL
jgi:hypothetical protein